MSEVLWNDFKSAQAERQANRCERVIDDGTRCVLTATQDVDGDWLCDEHAEELND